MTNPDRPAARPRSKATPAVDETAGATPIAPAAFKPIPTATSMPGAFAQLNVRITLDIQADVEYLMTQQSLNKVTAVSDAIRRRAADLRAAERR